jgi:hypothetical protein
MGDEISEHSNACHKKTCKILWVPIMPGTRILCVPLFFWTFPDFLLGLFCWEDACQEHTVQLITGSRGWKKSKDCLSSRKKFMDAAGIEHVTSMWKTSTSATKPRGLDEILIASFFHLNELDTSEFWLNLYHSRRPKQTFVKYASLVYEPGATKLSLFLQQWSQEGAVSVTECKMWSANP